MPGDATRFNQILSPLDKSGDAFPSQIMETQVRSAGSAPSALKSGADGGSADWEDSIATIRRWSAMSCLHASQSRRDLGSPQGKRHLAGLAVLRGANECETRIEINVGPRERE